MQIRHLLLLTGLVCVALLAACNKPAKTTASGGGSTKAPRSGPGIDFTRTPEGLPTQTLDYIGTEGFALAGAHGGGMIYFGVEAEEGYRLFSRDLKTVERRAVADFTGVVPGSLSCDDSGKHLFFCRAREIEKYIDDPNIRGPQKVGVVYTMPAAGGEEKALFDFRTPEFMPYRNPAMTPFCSRDGMRAATLSFDYDRSMVAMQCDDWLAYDRATYGADAKYSAEEVASREDDLHRFFEIPELQAYLGESAGGLPKAGPIAEAHRAMVKEISTKVADPVWALLLWEAGQGRVVKLSVPQGYERTALVLQAVGNEVVLLSAQSSGSDGTPYSQLFLCDVSSGALTPAARYTGTIAYIMLSADEKSIELSLTPYLPEKKAFATDPVFRILPLDGSAPVDTALPGNFIHFVDFDSNGEFAVGQDATDLDLYSIDVKSGNKVLLCKLNSEITGLFYSHAAESAVVLENGFMFLVKLSNDPRSSDQWAGPEHFALADTAVRDFLTRLGMQLPSSWETNWEERSGLGKHEYSGLITFEDKPGIPMLFRIEAEGSRVVSAWFPNGYPAPLSEDLSGGSLDVVDCQERAELAMSKLGWLSDAKQRYQPGGSPIYDKPSDSYVIVHHDGYMLQLNGKDEWVQNAESTIRINAGTGQLLEMNLKTLPQVTGQSAEIPMDQVVLSIRNEGPQPIPQSAPVRFDTENYRLAVAQKQGSIHGPALFEYAGAPRLCYEIDGYLQPEEQLILTTRVDTETGEVLGQMQFMPSNQQAGMGNR